MPHTNTFGNFSFNGVTKVISVSLGTVQFSASEVYSRWKDWLADDPERLKYLPAFSNSVGGESLGSGTLVGAYYFLQNGWKIKPQEADHQLSVSGNLFPIPDTAGLFEDTIGDFQVIVGMRASSLTQTVVTSSGGGSGNAPTAQQVATAVWSEDLTNKTSGAGKTVKDIDKTTKATLGVSV